MSVTFPVQYPQDIPLESVKEVFRIAFQDHSLDSEYQAATLHGYGIVGYGLKVSIGEPTAKLGASGDATTGPDIALTLDAEACNDDEAHNMLAALIEGDEKKFGAIPINWMSLALWVIQNIILKKRS